MVGVYLRVVFRQWEFCFGYRNFEFVKFGLFVVQDMKREVIRFLFL